MSVRLSRRAAVFAAALPVLASCSPVPRGETTLSSSSTPVAADTTAQGPVYVPARPANFAFAGELTQGGWVKGTVPSGTRALTLDGKPITVAPDGSFFAAFDRDAGRVATLVATSRTGEQASRALTVAPRAWAIENVNIARRQSGPSEAFMALRRPELARIEAARNRQTDTLGWRQDFIWPIKARISGRFGSQRVYRGEPGAYHSGIDLAGGAGTAFVAPAAGVVVLAADHPFTLEGNLLMIDHGMGLNSAFLHCSAILVREGEHVKQGQVIARIGATGRATGPHLHWSVKWNDARLDPILLTGPMK
jgi:murein DD-endopeptidase MepM/ murein hydrolase activator NlpD